MPRRRRPRTRASPRDWRPIPLPNWYGLLAPLLTRTFSELRVSVAVWVERNVWHPLHVVPGISAFESDFDLMGKRWDYNERSFVELCHTRQPMMGRHAGFSDLFVP